MTRRTALALYAAAVARTASRFPANRNVRWALGANLWNSFPRVPFAAAKTAMTFLKEFDARHLVVFPPNRRFLTDLTFKSMCDCFNKIGEAAGEMGFQAGLHNHMDEMVQTAEEIDRSMALTDPKLFHFSPATAHLYLADCDVVKTLEKHKSHLMLLDYKDARKVGTEITDNAFDLDVARNGPRASYERCGAYVVDKLDPIYA